MTDQAALAALARGQAETAFEELFARHRAMVYSACLRVLNDEAGAKDAAQNAFIALCRKAPALRPDICVGGWLYKAARAEALNRRRAVSRRTANEQQAMEMNAVEEESLEDAWSRVRPEMDEAMGALPEKLRDAVVLRYLEGNSREVAAAALGCEVKAFDKRVSRGLEGLRAALRKKGVAVSSAALSTLLATRSVEAAPAFGWPTVGELISAAAKGSVGVFITKGTLIMLSIKKVVAVAAMIAVAVAAGYGGLKAINKTAAKTGVANAADTTGRVDMRKGAAAKSKDGGKPQSKRGSGGTAAKGNATVVASSQKKVVPGKQEFVASMMGFMLASGDDARFKCLAAIGMPISRAEFDAVMRRLRAHNPRFPDRLPWEARSMASQAILKALCKELMERHPTEFCDWGQAFSSLDPNNASGMCNPLWVDWYKRDTEGVLAYLGSMPDQDMVRKLSRILKNPEASLAETMSMTNEEGRMDSLGLAINCWGMDNPAAAERWIEENLKGADKDKAVAALIGALKDNFSEVDRLAATLPEDLRTEALNSYFDESFARDPVNAFKELLRLREENRLALYPRGWGYGDYRGVAIMGGLSKMSDKESVEVAELCAQSFARGEAVDGGLLTWVLSRAGLADPERSLEIADMLNDTEKTLVKSKIIEWLATSDPGKAMELNERKKLTGEATILAAWGAADPAAALAWLSGRDNAEAKISTVLLGWAGSDPRAAIDYLKSSNIPVGYDVKRNVFSFAYLADKKMAWTFYDSLEPSTEKEKMLLDIALVMGTTETTESMEKIIDANISADGRDGKLLEIAERLSGVSPMPADTVMMLLGKINLANVPAEKEQALIKMAGKFTGKPELILNWAAKAGEDCPPLRGASVKMIEGALTSWNAKTPEAAAAWLDSCQTLDDAEKDEIRRKLKDAENEL